MNAECKGKVKGMQTLCKPRARNNAVCVTQNITYVTLPFPQRRNAAACNALIYKLLDALPGQKELSASTCAPPVNYRRQCAMYGALQNFLFAAVRALY